MSTVLLVGAGRVGAEAARQLAATPAVDRVLVADPDPARVQAVRDELGEGAAELGWSPENPLPEGVDAVAVAAPGGADVAVVARAVEAGVPVATCGEDPASVQCILEQGPGAREAGVAVVAGAGMAPGLSELLARHAADALDGVDEVHVARFGVAGPASRSHHRRACWSRAEELDGGAWTTLRAGGGRRLVYFPEPVGPHDCRRSASAIPRLLSDAVGSLDRATAREAACRQGWIGTRRRDPLGALYVEVRGRRGRAREVLTLGVVDHLTVVAGTVLALSTAAAAGLVPVIDRPAAGAGSVASRFPARAFLAELARRGVRAARFEGGEAA